MKRIFVQIPSYRDPECQWTLKDLFEKAKYPDRVFVGICWQFYLDTDKACFEIPFAPDHAGQVRVGGFHWNQSHGVCWARSEAQKLWQGEEYSLVIDSHMRFVQDWDERMIAALAQCPSPKPLLSSHPASYTPPGNLQADPLPTVLHATPISSEGSMRVRGMPLVRAPKKPLRGAFVAPGFMFADSAVISEVPYDPWMYFEQEELSMAARLFTHGWVVYSPHEVLLYHYYTPTHGAPGRPMHWNDNPGWREMNDIARQRLGVLLGTSKSDDPAVVLDIDRYGLGRARTLKQFGDFCGIDFDRQVAGPKALEGGFIKNLGKYLDQEAAVVAAPALQRSSKNEAGFARLLRDSPQGDALDIERGAPDDVLIIYNYADRPTCERLVRYADAQAYTELHVVDPDLSTPEKMVTQKNDGRVTHHVDIDGMAGEILTIFNDVYCRRLAAFYDVDFEWYERPQILRYPAGGKYDRHADADHWLPDTNTWTRAQDRDFSVLLYLNDAYEGGELELIEQRYSVKPRPGMLLAFPSDHRFLHAALPTRSGIRYVIVSWAAVVGTRRARPQMPFASVYVRQKRAQ